MEFINSFLTCLTFIDPATLPSLNWIGELVNWMNGWIGSYGWTVVVFTVFLKVITLPLDFWQRLVTKKNSVKMEEMKPMIEHIDKQYASDPRKANEEKSKLYKKQGYSMAGTCLPLIITMAVFIIMFSGLQSYTNFVAKRNYALLDEAYSTAYAQEYKASGDQYAALKAGKQSVQKVFTEEVSENFLWIKNIWRADTWSSTMATAEEYVKGGMGSSALTTEEKANFSKEKYAVIRQAVIEIEPGYFGKINDDGTVKEGWNGLLILPVLAVVLTFLSSWITQKQTAAKKPDPNAAPDPTQQSNKVMMFMMPIIMGSFALFYTAAFAVYMVSNSLLTIISSLLMQPIVDARLAKMNMASKDAKTGYRR